MTIGEAAARSGASPRMIRHYENVGLVPSPVRTEAGYREYDETAVATLRFIRRARAMDFSLQEIGRLLHLWRDRHRASAQVKAVVDQHIQEIDRKVAELRALRRNLADLARSCHDDDRPDCRILEQLVQPDGTTGMRQGKFGSPSKRSNSGGSSARRTS